MALFKGTILDGAELLWLEDGPALVKPTSSETVSREDCRGTHYTDVISNVHYHIKKNASDECKVIGIKNVPESAKIESLVRYLIPEEIDKLVEDRYEDADAIAFIQRLSNDGIKK